MLVSNSRTIWNSICFISFILVIIGCRSNRYFATPDYFTKQPGTLVLKNGEKIEGEISVNNLTSNSVVIQTQQNRKKQKYHANDVKRCQLEIGVFEPMLMAREIPGIHSLPVFMEKLTPDSFSLSLYESYQRQTNPNMMGNVTPVTGVEYDLQYFVHLPYDDSNVVWQLSTAVLTDHLRNGLDSLFRQCPDLLAKINSGDPNYDIYFSPQVEVTDRVTLGRLSSSGKAEKVKRIIGVFAEYEKCRRS